MTDHFSADLLWEVTKGWNSYQVKRRSGGGVNFSRDPLNLLNKQTRKHTGFINDQAIGITPSEKGVTLTTKKGGDKANKPASHRHTSGLKGSGRKSYSTVVSSTAKRGYRADLRQAAVARTSAIQNSQREKKDRPAAKPRGVKAKKAEE
ncbi:ribosomal protein L28e [Microthyrium microscopicum]|uniref:Ribosomal protein L28e n=1 Tax=Microthyrium microscopicum TaxID=703497 RepID=A0A6A6U5L5_9PEZI|nr:ribosomal protein L28e [Microthyrium microscopicum]